MYQCLCSDFVTREYHPKVLERLHLLRCIFAHVQNTLPWASWETQYHKFLVLIFVPAWSHAAENRSSAWWRTCWEDLRMQYQFVRKKQMIHPAVPNSYPLYTALLSDWRVSDSSPLAYLRERTCELDIGAFLHCKESRICFVRLAYGIAKAEE